MRKQKDVLEPIQTLLRQRLVGAPTDAELETAIEFSRLQILAAYHSGNHDLARLHATTMNNLIWQRSPMRVGEMERARGLR